jgi:iron complex outermembrane recepter protein
MTMYSSHSGPGVTGVPRGTRNVRLAAAIGAALATAFVSAPVVAADSGSVLEEVVVTAQFREQNLQDTPIAITAVTADMLDERSQTSILDIANQAPNLTLQRGTAGFGPTMQTFIRGVGQSDFNFAFEPGVGMYIDDVYYSTLTGSIFDLLDLDRVEVLRGPQGTLAGMNSMGGSIKLYSKKPAGDGTGFFEVTYGSYDRTDFRGSVDFAIIPDKLSARVAGVVRHSEGYVDTYDYACTHPGILNQAGVPAVIGSGQSDSNCKIGTEGGKAYDAVRASFLLTPTDDLEINFIADTTHDRSEAIPQTLIFVGATRTLATTSAPWTQVLPGFTASTAPTPAAAIPATFPRFTSAPTNGLNIWNPATQRSPYIAYSPFGPYNGDTFTNSPYVNYSTFCDALPIDGTAAWCADPKSEVSGYGLSAQVDYKINEALAVTLISSYREYDAFWAQDYDASPLSNALLTYDLWHWQWSHELRLSGTLFADTVNWVVGAFYFDQKSHYGGRNELGTVEFIEDDYIPATNQAVFANFGWAVTDNFEINAGVRYSEEEKTFTFGRGGIPGNNYPPCIVNGVNYGNVNAQFCGLNGKSGYFEGDEVDYRAVVQYRWTPDIMTYASVATGFKGGGVNPRPFTPEQAVPFNSETITAYELGTKTAWFDNLVSANVSLFQNQYDDFIASVASNVGAALPNLGCPMNPNSSFCSFYINAGEARVRGAELEVQARPIDGLSIDGSVSHLDFEYTKLTGCSLQLVGSGCPANTGGLGANIRADMQSPFSPEWKYSVGIQYEVLLGAMGSLTPRVDWSYSSDFYGTAVNTELGHVPGHHLANARLTWRQADGKWQSSLEVTNLADKLYYYGYFPNGSNGTVVGNPAPPRQWALSIKYKFE